MFQRKNDPLRHVCEFRYNLLALSIDVVFDFHAFSLPLREEVVNLIAIDHVDRHFEVQAVLGAHVWVYARGMRRVRLLSNLMMHAKFISRVD